MTALTWADVSGRRLERQGLAAPLTDATPADVVAAMCGAHAQVMSAAELSIALRLDGGTLAGVRGALWTERTLVKTYGPRGTVHLLPARDLHLWTAALADAGLSSSQPKDVRLTPAQTDLVVAAIADSLADAELTIDELGEQVVVRTGPWAGELVMPAFQELWPRWRQAITTAAHRGVLVFAPNRGRRTTVTNPRRWLAEFALADGAEAGAELLRRYLRAYGPATPEHYAKWLGGASLRWTRGRFAAIADELEPIEIVGGVGGWVLAGDTARAVTPAHGVRLLPHFDAYAVAGQPRELLYAGAAYERATARGQAGNFPVVLVDGTVEGVWHQRRAGRRLEIAVEMVRRLNAHRRRQIEHEVERIAALLGTADTLTFGPVPAGPHA